MTLIFAVRDGQCTVLGCDSLCMVGECARTPQGCWKAWEVRVRVVGGSDDDTDELILFGCAGDVHDISLLRHAFAWPPRQADVDVYTWLVATAVPAMHKFLCDLPNAKPAIETELIEAVVCAKPGRLFCISSDQTVTEHDDFVVAGSASGEASAAYEAVCLVDASNADTASWDRVEYVFEAVMRVRTDVRGPVHMLSL